MLCFAAYSNGKPAQDVDLAGAYLVGTDDVPLRAEISFKGGVITCQKRTPGPAGLVLLRDVDGVGTVLLDTVRVPERKRPYILSVELARGRLMRLHQKLEDWGLHDYEAASPILEMMTRSRDILIQALQADTPATSSQLADEALAVAVRCADALSQFHAETLLGRRRASNGLGKRVFGCAVHLDPPTEEFLKRLRAGFDSVTLPMVWRQIEAKEQAFTWGPLDRWVELLAKHRFPIRGAGLLSFHERNVPDWLYIWEHDFDTIRDLAFEHARRVLNRYGQYVHSWNVISGIHAENCFTFNFEQLMELTRMAAALAKKVAPKASAVIELVAPWGEYYARNQRTIPPLLYADMVAQSGVPFDAFGLQFVFGPCQDGMFVRDMFQISAVLDQFAKLNKPIHVTAAQVPSGNPEHADGIAITGLPAPGGVWRDPWDEKIQAEWLERFLEVALSKPFVESVSWQALADNPSSMMPHGGLLQEDLVPKRAYEQLVRTRAALRGQTKASAKGESESAA